MLSPNFNVEIEENKNINNATNDFTIEKKNFNEKKKILFYACEKRSGQIILSKKKIEPVTAFGIDLINPKKIIRNKTFNNKFFILTQIHLKRSIIIKLTNDMHRSKLLESNRIINKNIDSIIIERNSCVEYMVLKPINIEILSGEDLSQLTNEEIIIHLIAWRKRYKHKLNPNFSHEFLNIQFEYEIVGRKGESRVLYHATNKEAAHSILNSKKMVPGSQGMYGAGIYFAESEDICKHKTAQGEDYLITALVILNKSLFVKSLPYNIGQLRTLNYEFIKKLGVQSVIGKTNSGLEYVVYRSKDVKVICGKEIGKKNEKEIMDILLNQLKIIKNQVEELKKSEVLDEIQVDY